MQFPVTQWTLLAQASLNGDAEARQSLDDADRNGAAKRGGGQTPLSLDAGDGVAENIADHSPDIALQLDREWALHLVARALGSVRRRWEERLLEELETNQRIRAERWLAPRSSRIHGWMDYEDIYRDAVLAAPDGAHFVEVGVWQGRSLCFLAEMMLACGKRFRIDGVDPFRNYPGTKTGYPANLRPLVTGHSWMDVVSANLRRQGMLDYVNLIQVPSPAAARIYEDYSLDFVWIDGAHDYNSVLNDCRAWWPKIRRGGTLAGHDYDQPQVKQAVADARLDGACIAARGRSFIAGKPVTVAASQE